MVLEYMENEILIVIIIYISVKLWFAIIIKISFRSFIIDSTQES